MPRTITRATQRLIDLINKPQSGEFVKSDPFPFERVGRFHSWRHYGIMIPDISDGEFFDVMGIIGNPGVALFDTSEIDARPRRNHGSVLSTTGSTECCGLQTFSSARDFNVDPTGHTIEMGSGVRISRTKDTLHINSNLDDMKVDVEVRLTNTISHFARIPLLYDHWSVLSLCSGTITKGNDEVPFKTLGTAEFARGVGVETVGGKVLPNLPVLFFAYHILNVDKYRQILITDVAFNDYLPVLRRIYLRKLDTPDRLISSEFVSSYDGKRRGPDGRSTACVPGTISIDSRSKSMGTQLNLSGIADNNWKIGIGSGYAGTYKYEGSLFGENISGQAYLEYVDLR